MTALVITGWSAVTFAGIGVDALVRQLSGTRLSAVPVGHGVPVGELYDEPLPAPDGQALPGFDVRAELGRKGTGWYDRATALAVVSCRDALRESGVPVAQDTDSRIGVALGTTLGSFKSASDYTRETLVQERPYWVNPSLFPTTVINCAAGQVAIRLGLRGVNATITGGGLAFLNSLRYASRVIGRGYADVMLTGAVEEYTPHRAWAGHLTGTTTGVPLGEAAAAFVLAGAQGPPWALRREEARVLAVTTGYSPGDGGLERCVARTLRQADMSPSSISTVFTGETDEEDTREFGPVVRVLEHEPERVLSKRVFGECDGASGAVALAAMLAGGRAGVTGDGPALITAVGPDGGVGAAVVERSGQ